MVKELYKELGIEWLLDEAHLSDVFKAYDLDGSGCLSRYEMRALVG